MQQGVGGRPRSTPTADKELLKRGPVHYGVTPLPGAGEPFAVAGHRTTYGAPFSRLDALREGDKMIVETPYARFDYKVAKTTVVLPNDVTVLADRGYGLVLTTCTPRYSASHRLDRVGHTGVVRTAGSPAGRRRAGLSPAERAAVPTRRPRDPARPPRRSYLRAAAP